jgi:hypothetical protein
MAKLPKFMIAKNDLIDETEYIAHSRDPVFFAKIIHEGRSFRLEPDRDVPDKLMARTKDWYIAYISKDKNDRKNSSFSE